MLSRHARPCAYQLMRAATVHGRIERGPESRVDRNWQSDRMRMPPVSKIGWQGGLLIAAAILLFFMFSQPHLQNTRPYLPAAISASLAPQAQPTTFTSVAPMILPIQPSMSKTAAYPLSNIAQFRCSRQQPIAPTPTEPLRLRHSKATRLAFAEEIDSIGGWVQPQAAYAVALLSREQRRLKIHGSVGEIGVFHGKFFTCLAHSASANERMWAVDIFDDQSANVDGSGKGDNLRQTFETNIKRFGVDPKSCHLHQAPSTALDESHFFSNGLFPSRFISVDGGHTSEIAFHDLNLASCMLVQGGIIVLDDWLTGAWIGVTEAVFRFFASTGQAPTLAPFASFANKLWLSTPTYADHYRKVIAQDSVLKPYVYLADSPVRSQMLGYHVTILSEGDKDVLKKGWKALIEEQSQPL